MSNCGSKCDKGNIYLFKVRNRNTMKSLSPYPMKKGDLKNPYRKGLICVLPNFLYNEAKFYPKISCSSQITEINSLVEGLLCNSLNRLFLCGYSIHNVSIVLSYMLIEIYPFVFSFGGLVAEITMCYSNCLLILM